MKGPHVSAAPPFPLAHFFESCKAFTNTSEACKCLEESTFFTEQGKKGKRRAAERKNRRLLSSLLGSISSRRLTSRQWGRGWSNYGNQALRWQLMICISFTSLFPSVVAGRLKNTRLCWDQRIFFSLGFQEKGSSVHIWAVFYQHCFQWDGGRWLSRIR